MKKFNIHPRFKRLNKINKHKELLRLEEEFSKWNNTSKESKVKDIKKINAIIRTIIFDIKEINQFKNIKKWIDIINLIDEFEKDIRNINTMIMRTTHPHQFNQKITNFIKYFREETKHIDINQNILTFLSPIQLLEPELIDLFDKKQVELYINSFNPKLNKETISYLIKNKFEIKHEIKKEYKKEIQTII